MQRSEVLEDDVQRQIAIILANRIAEAKQHVSHLQSECEAKDKTLQEARADLIRVRSRFTHTDDILRKVTETDKERVQAQRSLEMTTAKYQEDMEKYRATIAALEEKNLQVTQLEASIATTNREAEAYCEQFEEAQKQLSEWKVKVTAAIKETMAKEKELRALVTNHTSEIDDLQPEVTALKERLEAEKRKKASVATTEMQTDEELSYPPVDVVISVRFSLPDHVSLDSKLTCKDNILVKDLCAMSCRKIGPKANKELDPQNMCLIFSTANQAKALSLALRALSRSKEKEYVLEGNRQLRSWSMLKNLISSNTPLILKLVEVNSLPRTQEDEAPAPKWLKVADKFGLSVTSPRGRIRTQTLHLNLTNLTDENSFANTQSISPNMRTRSASLHPSKMEGRSSISPERGKC